MVNFFKKKIMTAVKPDVKPDGRYSINETCLFLGLKSRNTLRSYVEKGLIKQGTRKTNGRPFYLGSEIMKCWSSVY